MTMHLRLICIASLLSIALTACATTDVAINSVNLNDASETQKLSYLLGSDMYEKRSRQGFTIDAEMVAQAIRDEQTGIQPEMSSAEYMRMVTLKRKKVAEFETRWQARSEKNLSAGKAFMETSALKAGVVSTESGLQYKILRPGTGKQPSADDIARIHYRGTLLSGEEFDSSYKRGKPSDFPVGKVKPALREILLLMRGLTLTLIPTQNKNNFKKCKCDKRSL